MDMEQLVGLVDWEVAEETEVLGEGLTQCHFFHHKCHKP
jgi:hypothetical protein